MAVEVENLIEELGGIESARGILLEVQSFDWENLEGEVLVKWTSARKRLEQAIHDYESIYGV